jgi:SsrA-binding protein
VILYAKNKKAYHDYAIIESFTAGLSLLGTEVKSIRSSNIQLRGSYCYIKDNRIFLTDAHISRPSYLRVNQHFEESREIPLLVTKSELKKITEKVKEKGISLVITKIFQPEDSKKIKAELALVKGKKEYDKRETLKRKQADIDAKREMSQKY